MMYLVLDRILFWTFYILAGSVPAQHLRVIADWLYPADNSSTELYRRTKFLLRSLLQLRPSVEWFAFLCSNEKMLSLLRQHPYIAEKIYRPYSCRSLSTRCRMEKLMAHYSLALYQSHDALMFAASCGDRTLADVIGKSGRTYSLVLGSAYCLPKEGELVLRLECEGFALLKAAFTCDYRDGLSSLTIGCWQGNNCASSKDRLREATRDMFGLRPRSLLFLGLQAYAEYQRIASIVGVSDREHIYSHWRKRRDIMQSYDSLWSDMGGIRERDGMFLLPLEHSQRPLSAYPSHKRSAMTRRHALENQVLAKLAVAFAAAQITCPGTKLPSENRVHHSNLRH